MSDAPPCSASASASLRDGLEAGHVNKIAPFLPNWLLVGVLSRPQKAKENTL